MIRVFDLIWSVIGLAVLSPCFLVVAALIKLDDQGPVFYQQLRIGHHGNPFWILKFRTMTTDADQGGPSLTVGQDARVTRIGRRLRAWKIDELPQLINVFLGEMSLVGPRPEVPRYVALYTEAQARVLRLRPGITDAASIAYRNENELLGSCAAPEDYYVQTIMPDKIRINLDYAAHATLWTHVQIILATLGLLRPPVAVREVGAAADGKGQRRGFGWLGAGRERVAGNPLLRWVSARVCGLQARWLAVTTGSVNRRVFGAAMVVAGMTVALKAFSLFKETVVAASFGTGNAFDAFTIALLVPTSLASILAGSLDAALIPTYIEVRELESAEAADRLYATILLWNVILLVGMTLIMAATVNLWLPLLASGFAPAKLGLARTLVYGSLPIVVLTGFSTIWGALLNAGERFAGVAIAPALQPIAIVLLLGLFLRHWGIYALLAGTLLGLMLETGMKGLLLARKGHTLLPHWHGVTSAFRKVRAQYATCIAASFIVNGMGMVDQAFASTLGPRSNSSLSYGSKLESLVLSLGATALATAILPALSRMVALKDWQGIRRFLRFYGSVILSVSIPVTLLLIVLSRFLIRVMYQHGSFTAADTTLVAQIQVFYLLRIPFATCHVLVTRTLTALKALHFLLIMSFSSFTLNALLDWLFIKRFGVAGITLSTSACSVVTLTCLAVAMYRLLDQKANEAKEAGR
jgi:putative peptidoglycan lipid II flippase